jgi:hypothetical protein
VSDDIDRLLSAPLAEPADDGFSLRVMLRTEAVRMRAELAETFVWIVAAAALLALLPLTAAGQAVAAAGTELAQSMPFALGAGFLVLAWLALRNLPALTGEA